MCIFYFFFLLLLLEERWRQLMRWPPWHLHLLNHRFRKLGGVLCGFSVCGFLFEKNKRKTTRCFCWEGKPKCQRQSVMGEFRGLEAGQQKPVPQADGDVKAKADAERGLLLLFEVLRGMAALSRPRKSTHLPTHPIKKKQKKNSLSVSAR